MYGKESATVLHTVLLFTINIALILGWSSDKACMYMQYKTVFCCVQFALVVISCIKRLFLDKNCASDEAITSVNYVLQFYFILQRD